MYVLVVNAPRMSIGVLDVDDVERPDVLPCRMSVQHDVPRVVGGTVLTVVPDV